MSWFWLNVPAMALFFAAWCGIPMFMVLRHPTWGPQRADSAELVPVKPPRAVQIRREVRPSATVAGSTR